MPKWDRLINTLKDYDKKQTMLQWNDRPALNVVLTSDLLRPRELYILNILHMCPSKLPVLDNHVS